MYSVERETVTRTLPGLEDTTLKEEMFQVIFFRNWKPHTGCGPCSLHGEELYSLCWLYFELTDKVDPAERSIEAIRPQKTVCACNLEAVTMEKDGERQL